ncbi:MAG: CDP-alcohol phosphatidyltransferase family protein [Syntrophales bacterium]|jgi:cardiolipin synthase|nr:CDP-alcohol phosphatidyltransferase family protein [Syntrophales bacterium]NLN60349.1 CDP-diacylglycerol--glycerol-3-phosphate 3-phosphatidyltransferase [Deltaproteobacteria bacterium]
MNIPNLLTLLRILLVPLIVIFLIDGEYIKALIIFSISGVTDALDGFLARLLRQRTILGAYLDPIADKALLITCFLTLAIEKIIPGWLTVVVISRDVIILVGISVLFMMSVPFDIKPILVSKITTTLQIITVLLVLVLKSLPEAIDFSWILFLYWLTALFTIVSGLRYIVVGMRYFNTLSAQD